MSIKDLGQRYAEDEARQKRAIEELREKFAEAERRINEIVADLHKETGLFIEIEPASGIYHNYTRQGDNALGLLGVGFQKSPRYQTVYQVAAKVTA